MIQNFEFNNEKLSIGYFIDIQNSEFQHKTVFQSIQKSKPWQVLKKIPSYLDQFFQKKLESQIHGKLIGSVHIDSSKIYVGQGTVIQHGAVIKSPTIIGKNCEIRKNAYLRGNVIIGNNVLINSQIKNSLILNDCQIPHLNYVGDTILGTKAHLSAGAITSNFRLDGKQINVLIGGNQKSIKTQMTKFGAIVGDGAQIGCNVVLNPGSLIGKGSWIYPNVSFRGFLQSNKILKLKQQHTIQIKKL